MIFIPVIRLGEFVPPSTITVGCAHLGVMALRDEKLVRGGHGKILIGIKTLAAPLSRWVSSAMKSSSKEGSYGSHKEDV